MGVGIRAGGDVAIFDFVKTDVQAFSTKKGNRRTNSLKTGFRKRRDLEEDDTGC